MSSKKASLFSNNLNVQKEDKIDINDNIKASPSNNFQKAAKNIMRASKMIKNNYTLQI